MPTAGVGGAEGPSGETLALAMEHPKSWPLTFTPHHALLPKDPDHPIKSKGILESEILGLGVSTEDGHPSKKDPHLHPPPQLPEPSLPLTRQPQAQQDAVVDDRDDTHHARRPLWGFWPMAFPLLACPTAVGCGQQGRLWRAS